MVQIHWTEIQILLLIHTKTDSIQITRRGIEVKVGYEKSQLVTISRPSAYGEYEPYHFVDTEEFVHAIE